MERAKIIFSFLHLVLGTIKMKVHPLNGCVDSNGLLFVLTSTDVIILFSFGSYCLFSSFLFHCVLL